MLVVLLAALGASQAQNPPTPIAGQIFGIVRSGTMAVPGATVMATNTDTGARVVSTSNPDGSYALPVAAGD